MKTKNVIAASLTMALAAAVACSQEPSRCDAAGKCVKNYVRCFESGNNGVVESATGMAAMLRLACPHANLEPLNHKLDSLAVNGETPAIRYKAYLAGLVFDSPSLYADIATRRYASSDEFLAAVARRLNESILGAN